MLEVLDKYREESLALAGPTIFFFAVTLKSEVIKANITKGFQIKKFLYRKRNTWPGKMGGLNR